MGDDGNTQGFDPSRRDLGFVEPVLPALHDAVKTYFRSRVEGLERIPEGGSILVANHSGGHVTPDSVVFVLSYLREFGVDAPLYWLGHDAILQLPVLGPFLRRCGVISADHETAEAALDAGATVLVYPGGELEMHRPWWERNRIKFQGRKGFLRLAARTGAPVVPMVSSGAHNTYLPLTDGRWLARALGIDKRFRIKALPISLALPWGLNVSDYLLHLPLPAKIQVHVLDPITIGPDDDIDEQYEKITAVMEDVLVALDR